MTDMADPVEETYAERARIADLLESLSPQQWSADSLCAGWRIREVVAHMISPFHTRPAKMLWGMVRAGFSYDRYAARARARTRRRGRTRSCWPSCAAIFELRGNHQVQVRPGR